MAKKKFVEFVENPTPEQFSMMVEAHDPTYSWSDDPVFRERESNKAQIIERAKEFLGDEAVRIWNEAMRRKIVPSFLDEFVWSKSRKSHA
jgi:hypothetical protein